MEFHERNDDERRLYDFGIPPGVDERRSSIRRELDWSRSMYSSIFDRNMEETVSDEKIKNITAPVIEKIKSGAYDK